MLAEIIKNGISSVERSFLWFQHNFWQFHWKLTLIGN